QEAIAAAQDSTLAAGYASGANAVETAAVAGGGAGGGGGGGVGGGIVSGGQGSAANTGTAGGSDRSTPLAGLSYSASGGGGSS
ncbi:hypothetical protein J8J27_32800, partial [Mycobacterium tuberculosis]|nr:hypothetical protein [Mycobacterium tuberculosis]